MMFLEDHLYTVCRKPGTVLRNTEIFHPGNKSLNTCSVYQHPRENLQTENK